ncbi:hypothetical protein [Halpernia sp. GG3]
MMKSFSLEEMAQKNWDKQKEGRIFIDHLYKLFNENKFQNFKLEKIQNGYSLKSEEISYFLEKESVNDYNSRLTVIYKDGTKCMFKRDEILEEKYINGSLKVGLDEFHVYLETLLENNDHIKHL